MANTQTYDTKDDDENLVLIGLDKRDCILDIKTSLDELKELVETAGGNVVGQMVQNLDKVNRVHYFGKGKIEELKAYCKELGATGIVCDDELSQMQMRNMANALDLKIMNRTLVILDIFANMAKSAEGKVQVELAQLKYRLSHLTGQGISMSRQGGGIGSKGPGEKKLEIDKRHITDKIAELSRELKDIERHRQTAREKRMKNKIPVVALIGYTNAGKSSLMNAITGADTLSMNKLFATLDTTTRSIILSSGRQYLFTDTVGFIQKLPHNLVKAFKSTLDEAKYADILVHVVDTSSKYAKEQMDIVYSTLKELGCINKPIITAFNKIDKKDSKKPYPKDDYTNNSIEISAKEGTNIENLKLLIEDVIKSFKKSIQILIPYENSSIINIIYGRCEIVENINKDDGIYFELYADEEMENRLKDFII